METKWDSFSGYSCPIRPTGHWFCRKECPTVFYFSYSSFATKTIPYQLRFTSFRDRWYHFT